MLKAVIFDLDDTLYTDWETCHQAGLDEVGAYGALRLGLPKEEMMRCFLNGRARAYQQLGDTGSAHNRTLYAKFGLEEQGINPILHAKNLHDTYWRGVFRTMVLEPAVPRLLTDLRAAGVRTVVCTNMMADIQMRKLVELGLDDAFDCFVASEEVGADKPAPAVFQYTLNNVGCTAEDAIMIGDSYAHDIEGAHRSGLRSLWINRKSAPVPEGGQPPTYAVRSMEQAAEIVRDLLRGQ